MFANSFLPKIRRIGRGRGQAEQRVAALGLGTQFATSGEQSIHTYHDTRLPHFVPGCQMDFSL